MPAVGEQGPDGGLGITIVPCEGGGEFVSGLIDIVGLSSLLSGRHGFSLSGEPSRSVRLVGFRLAAASPVKLELLARWLFDPVFEVIPIGRYTAVDIAECAPLRAAGMLAKVLDQAAFHSLCGADFVTHAACLPAVMFLICSRHRKSQCPNLGWLLFDR